MAENTKRGWWARLRDRRRERREWRRERRKASPSADASIRAESSNYTRKR